jgi:hypothetical protein
MVTAERIRHGTFHRGGHAAGLLRGLLGDALEPADLVSAMDRLDDDHCVRAITAADALARFSERLRAVGAGTLAARSPRMPGTAGSRSRAVIATPSRSCRT